MENSLFNWVSLGLAIAQALVIPITIALYRLTKKVIDSETALRIQKRDSQIEKLESRVSAIEKDHEKTVEKIFAKMDEMSEKLNELWIASKIKKEA